MQRKGAIRLETVEADESTIRCTFDYPRRLNPFFRTDTHVVEYDTSVDDVPEGIQSIPWLASVVTLAWATGTDVELPTLDRRYYESLVAVERTFREMYPAFMQGSEIRCGELTESPVGREEFDGTGILFSGGIDALATYLRHRDEAPMLVGVHGFDVDQGDSAAWEWKRERIESFGRLEGRRTRFAKTNMMSILDDFMINAHFRRFLDSDWYDSVQHGLALTGLCAPLAFAGRVGTMYMADSASEEYDLAIGNHPDVVDDVAWAHTGVQSDGFELTRQMKIEQIADFVDAKNFQLHTCLQPGIGNCNRCEKCLRTAFGLFLAGLDPNEHGYAFDENSFEYARERLVEGDWKLDTGQVVEWKDLRERARDREFDRPAAEEFFRWLDRVDLDGLGTQSGESEFLAYRISKCLPHVEAVQNLRRRVLDVVW